MAASGGASAPRQTFSQWLSPLYSCGDLLPRELGFGRFGRPPPSAPDAGLVAASGDALRAAGRAGAYEFERSGAVWCSGDALRVAGGVGAYAVGPSGAVRCSGDAPRAAGGAGAYAVGPSGAVRCSGAAGRGVGARQGGARPDGAPNGAQRISTSKRASAAAPAATAIAAQPSRVSAAAAAPAAPAPRSPPPWGGGACFDYVESSPDSSRAASPAPPRRELPPAGAHAGRPAPSPPGAGPAAARGGAPHAAGRAAAPAEAAGPAGARPRSGVAAPTAGAQQFGARPVAAPAGLPAARASPPAAAVPAGAAAAAAQPSSRALALRGAPAARAAPASHKRPRWSSEATFGYFDYIESSSDSEGVAPAAASRAAAAPVASAPLRRQRAAPVCHIEEVGTTLATGARVAEAPWASPFAEDLGMLAEAAAAAAAAEAAGAGRLPCAAPGAGAPGRSLAAAAAAAVARRRKRLKLVPPCHERQSLLEAAEGCLALRPRRLPGGDPLDVRARGPPRRTDNACPCTSCTRAARCFQLVHARQSWRAGLQPRSGVPAARLKQTRAADPDRTSWPPAPAVTLHSGLPRPRTPQLARPRSCAGGKRTAGLVGRGCAPALTGRCAGAADWRRAAAGGPDPLQLDRL